MLQPLGARYTEPITDAEPEDGKYIDAISHESAGIRDDGEHCSSRGCFDPDQGVRIVMSEYRRTRRC